MRYTCTNPLHCMHMSGHLSVCVLFHMCVQPSMHPWASPINACMRSCTGASVHVLIRLSAMLTCSCLGLRSALCPLFRPPAWPPSPPDIFPPPVRPSVGPSPYLPPRPPIYACHFCLALLFHLPLDALPSSRSLTCIRPCAVARAAAGEKMGRGAVGTMGVVGQCPSLCLFAFAGSTLALIRQKIIQLRHLITINYICTI